MFLQVVVEGRPRCGGREDALLSSCSPFCSCLDKFAFLVIASVSPGQALSPASRRRPSRREHLWEEQRRGECLYPLPTFSFPTEFVESSRVICERRRKSRSLKGGGDHHTYCYAVFGVSDGQMDPQSQASLHAAHSLRALNASALLALITSRSVVMRRSELGHSQVMTAPTP
ncbi:hypothetical protein O3P69_003924 [Scylla paramamosain]|uniref:Uncharacterized protein n=1 Tax=Scylla paramamosain TaxID=85552 RepID=A0AAW0UE75_SCYPA